MQPADGIGRCDSRTRRTDRCLDGYRRPLKSGGISVGLLQCRARSGHDAHTVNGMIDNVIYDKTGMYSLHTFALPEDAPAVAEVVARTAAELKTSAVEIHVNPAFVRYVTGQDRQ